MADEKDSHTQELSRAIDAAYSDYKPGEPDGEGRLYEALLAQAHNVVFYRLQRRDDHLARDIARRAMVALKGFRGESKLSTWFYKIAQNETYRTLREVIEERESSVSIDAHSATGAMGDASDPPELREQAKKEYLASENARNAKLDFDELRRGLPPKQEAVIALMAGGYSLQEIAKKTGEAIGTIRGRHRLAKEKMAARAKDAKK
jgi:RNA polymerase sigma-70 factor (ECF subfamily)